MDIAEYFANTKGRGILATSDADGNVDVAIYSRPYVIDEQTIALSMLERLSYSNIMSNPKAAFMYIEEGTGHSGTRLYLSVAGEETDAAKIERIKSQRPSGHRSLTDAARHLMYFKVERVRPLVGDAKE